MYAALKAFLLGIGKALQAAAYAWSQWRQRKETDDAQDDRDALHDDAVGWFRKLHERTGKKNANRSGPDAG